MMKDLIDSVAGLSVEELERTKKDWPPFASMHEGCAVILEELEEAETEMAKMKEYYNALWKSCKEDVMSCETANNLQSYALLCACECIQVAAMALKYQANMLGK